MDKFKMEAQKNLAKTMIQNLEKRNMEGYYAETKEELDRTIRQLRSRISKIAEAERGLVKACQMPQYGGGAPHNGQLNMFAQ